MVSLWEKEFLYTSIPSLHESLSMSIGYGSILSTIDDESRVIFYLCKLNARELVPDEKRDREE